AVADRTADGFDDRGASLELGRLDVLAVARHRGGVERPDLHRSDALVEQALRQLARAVELRLEVLVGPARAPRGLARAVGVGPGAGDGVVGVAGAGVVDRDLVAREAAEQLVDRRVQRLA